MKKPKAPEAVDEATQLLRRVHDHYMRKRKRVSKLSDPAYTRQREIASAIGIENAYLGTLFSRIRRGVPIPKMHDNNVAALRNFSQTFLKT